MCNLGRSDADGTGFGDVNPPMWGESVLEQYRSEFTIDFKLKI